MHACYFSFIQYLFLEPSNGHARPTIDSWWNYGKTRRGANIDVKKWLDRLRLMVYARLKGLIHPKWCRISAISSRSCQQPVYQHQPWPDMGHFCGWEMCSLLHVAHDFCHHCSMGYVGLYCTLSRVSHKSRVNPLWTNKKHYKSMVIPLKIIGKHYKWMVIPLYIMRKHYKSMLIPL